MDFFGIGNLLGINKLAEEEKITTLKQSEEFLLSVLEDYKDLVDFKNHKNYKLGNRDNVYRFTIKLLSLDMLVKVGSDKRVKNIFFSAANPPPGGGIDSISMRYKVYIEYYD
tara:strand:- start:419 stop:754 length:336 start_codon:yes stop_codon:yes gene_type:complete